MRVYILSKISVVDGEHTMSLDVFQNIESAKKKLNKDFAEEVLLFPDWEPHHYVDGFASLVYSRNDVVVGYTELAIHTRDVE